MDAAEVLMDRECRPNLVLGVDVGPDVPSLSEVVPHLIERR
jgi:hypothetical protein